MPCQNQINNAYTIINVTLSRYDVIAATQASLAINQAFSLSSVDHLSTQMASIETSTTESQLAISARLASLEQSHSLALSLITSLQSSLNITMGMLYNTSTMLASEHARALAAEDSLAVVTNALTLATNAEASRASFSESSLAKSLTMETSRAISTEDSLFIAISSLSTALQGAEQSATLSTDSESSRAVDTELSLANVQSSLSLSLQREVSRATAVEASTGSALDAEISRAITVESSLGVAVNVSHMFNGLTAAQAALSCLHIYANFNADSGVYWINPQSPFQVFTNLYAMLPQC